MSGEMSVYCDRPKVKGLQFLPKIKVKSALIFHGREAEMIKSFEFSSCYFIPAFKETKKKPRESQ
jgi:hypothetical protein